MDYRKDFDLISSAIAVAAPFVSSLLHRVKIILSEHVNTAGISPNGVLLVNPQFWSKLSNKAKAWLLGHEVLHIAFLDHKRQGKRNRKLWNLVTDCVNNDLLAEFLAAGELEDLQWTTQRLYWELSDSINMNYEKFAQLSKEEIYRLLPQKLGRCLGEIRCPKCGSGNLRVKELNYDKMTVTFKCESCGHEWTAPISTSGQGTPLPQNIPIDKIVGYPPNLPQPFPDLKPVAAPQNATDGESQVIQEGDPELYRGDLKPEELEEKWKDRIVRAYSAQKMAGRVPAGLKRLVDRLVKPQVDWQTLLRQALMSGLGRTIVASYSRPSRKHPSLPGIRRYTIPTVWFLADMSGSMGKEEVTQSMSELYSIARLCSFKVICWDARDFEPIEGKNQQDVIEKVLKKLRGGGGTVIEPTLRRVLREMKNKDIVVVFTDGEIWDISDPNTQMLFEQVASKASVAVFATTLKEHELKGWRTIRIKV